MVLGDGDGDLYAILDEYKQLKSEMQEQSKSNKETFLPRKENDDVDPCDRPEFQSEKQKHVRQFDTSSAHMSNAQFEVTSATSASSELVYRKVNPQKRIKLTPMASPTHARKIDKPLKSDVFILRIGLWKTQGKNLEDVLAKCYFGKRQLVWEILENRLKKKIQMPWENILAMRATIDKNHREVLEIELNEPPAFLRETKPEPRKHTKWEKATDFTNGQATICRRHYLQFPRGTLEKYYNALLKVPEFLYMSQNHFPSLQSPHFSAPAINNVGRNIFSLNCQENMLQPSSVQQPQGSKDSQSVNMDIVSSVCIGIDPEINFVQKQPNVGDLNNGGGTYFALASHSKEPQTNDVRQPSDSNIPMSVTHLQTCCQDSSLISDLFCEYDGTPLDELLQNFGDENASNMTLWDQPMTDYAEIAQRDVMSQGQFSAAPAVTFQENSVVPHQDYKNLPLTCNEEILHNQHQLLINDNWFPDYSNPAEGLNNKAGEKTDHSSSRL